MNHIVYILASGIAPKALRFGPGAGRCGGLMMRRITDRALGPPRLGTDQIWASEYAFFK